MTPLVCPWRVPGLDRAFREVGDVLGGGADLRQHREAILAQARILGIDRHLLEEGIDGSTQIESESGYVSLKPVSTSG